MCMSVSCVLERERERERERDERVKLKPHARKAWATFWSNEAIQVYVARGSDPVS